MKNIQIQDLGLSPEVTRALSDYNATINSALQAVQKLESIAITARLAALFGVKEEKTARIIQQDYLVSV